MKPITPAKKSKHQITALVANQAGQIFELNGYAAVGMSGQSLEPLSVERTRNLPHGSELMYLPDRRPILFNQHSGNLETLTENPYAPGESIFPVAAFNSPGHVITHLSAYGEMKNTGYLPLFSYGAVGWHRGKFRSAVVLVDSEPRQDLRKMQRNDVKAGVKKLRKQLPQNRLRAHLEKCALEYGCPAGKNFFLGRYEAPLPAAQQCNARCIGCLSLQPNDEIPCSQDRIGFTPSADEIAQVALAHIRRVKNSIVSFGQGCEGDPLLAAEVIEPAIDLIRRETDKGTINMNSNGSLPETVRRFCDAGLDSMRVSMNSVRPACYEAYFRPRGYRFADVLKSIKTVLEREKFVAINYLNCPGFTDTPQESEALIRFLQKYPINMIQWRNLNFDPLRYWKLMDNVVRHGEPIGVEKLIKKIRKQFPGIMHGYFNPPKEKFK
ncbi:MAG: radical SAM protein [Deltaproteobacteria bacterium]|jgi:pyruvate-formate lyase-activating enzyme|nr:radical SAM protein [Deltaproteobacteria bacterium]